MDKEKEIQLTPEEDKYNQRINDLKEVVDMRGGAGIRFLRRLMEDAGIYRTAYRGNAETNYVLGRQSLAIQIVADLEHAATRKQRADILL